MKAKENWTWFDGVVLAASFLTLGFGIGMGCADVCDKYYLITENISLKNINRETLILWAMNDDDVCGMSFDGKYGDDKANVVLWAEVEEDGQYEIIDLSLWATVDYGDGYYNTFGEDLFTFIARN